MIQTSHDNTRKRRSCGGSRTDLRFAFTPALLREPLLTWYQGVRRDLPWRVLWREHADPYHVWVSEIMLQQTVIKAVIPVYQRFLERFPDVAALAQASEEEIRQAVRGLGYYRRFRLMHAAARELIQRGEEWPQTFALWKELPGIGDYTAAAISSIAFDQPAAVVDGNVERVFCRLLDLREAPNEPRLKRAFKELANEFLDTRHPGDFNQALMELGQTVCTVSTPACTACPLTSGCLAAARGSQALAPAPKPQAQLVDVPLELVILQCGNKVGLYERPATARFLKGTWGFWTRLEQGGVYGRDGAAETALPAGITVPRPVGRVRHSITRHRISASVYTAELKSKSKGAPDIRWLAPADVEEHLVSNLDRKAWHLYQASATYQIV